MLKPLEGEPVVRRAAQFGRLGEQGQRRDGDTYPTERRLGGVGNVGTLGQLTIKSERLCRGPTPHIAR